MLAIHSETSCAYCLVVMPRPRATPAGELKFAGLLDGRFQVIVHSLAGLLCQLEP